MKKYFFLIGIVGLILTVPSCKKKGCLDANAKNYDPEAKKADGSCDYGTYSSLSEYEDQQTVSEELFTIAASSGGFLTTEKGSQVTIPANAFVTQGGAPVNGNVEIKIKEIFSNQDMINAGIFTNSMDTHLNSGGMFFLEASQGGIQLIVADGQFVNVKIPAQAQDTLMELFLAGPDENVANWAPADTATSSAFTFSSADNSYSLDLDSLGWANIDAFMTVNYFDIDFTLSGVGGLNNSNTTAYAVFEGENSVWPTGVSPWGDINNNLIHETHLGAVELNLIVISVIGGQLYYGLLHTTPAPNMNYDIPMSMISSDNLDDIIESLP